MFNEKVSLAIMHPWDDVPRKIVFIDKEKYL